MCTLKLLGEAAPLIYTPPTGSIRIHSDGTCPPAVTQVQCCLRLL